MPTKSRVSRVPFTVPNVAKSLMKILGEDTKATLSIEKGSPACDVTLQSPSRKLWPLDHFVIWRDDVMATFVSQCRPDYLVLGRRIIKELGGIHKVLTSELFVETPEGFIIHLIGEQDIATLKKLIKRSGHGRILT